MVVYTVNISHIITSLYIKCIYRCQYLHAFHPTVQQTLAWTCGHMEVVPNLSSLHMHAVIIYSFARANWYWYCSTVCVWYIRNSMCPIHFLLLGRLGLDDANLRLPRKARSVVPDQATSFVETSITVLAGDMAVRKKFENLCSFCIYILTAPKITVSQVCPCVGSEGVLFVEGHTTQGPCLAVAHKEQT